MALARRRAVSVAALVVAALATVWVGSVLSTPSLNLGDLGDPASLHGQIPDEALALTTPETSRLVARVDGDSYYLSEGISGEDYCFTVVAREAWATRTSCSVGAIAFGSVAFSAESPGSGWSQVGDHVWQEQ